MPRKRKQRDEEDSDYEVELKTLFSNSDDEKNIKLNTGK